MHPAVSEAASSGGKRAPSSSSSVNQFCPYRVRRSQFKPGLENFPKRTEERETKLARPGFVTPFLTFLEGA